MPDVLTPPLPPPPLPADVAANKAEVLSPRDLSQLLVTLALDLGHLPRERERRLALAGLVAPRLTGLQGGLLVDALDLLSR